MDICMRKHRYVHTIGVCMSIYIIMNKACLNRRPQLRTMNQNNYHNSKLPLADYIGG